MNTSLGHLSAGQREMLERAVKIIVRAVRPEKIILFGVYSGAGDAGLHHHLPRELGAFDLLVVTREEERRSDYELQDIIESRCREEVAVTALVHDIAYVNRRVKEGQYFFSMAVLEGILVFDARLAPLAEAFLPDLEAVRMLAEKDFERWMGQSGDFFHSAEFLKGQRRRNAAVFLLHQAAEQCYQAILLAFMGYKPTTHNLDKLRRYTNRFSIELAVLFPRDTKEEEELFRLLSSGYVNARYKEEFTISAEELEMLTERIRRLLDIAERVCLNHFISLSKRATSG
ncbi:HEPN domain-containing protein [Puia dinghuensis]|uniref:Nucleotidyltransferase n=1 Tax=Puia dinghuensis TaxID=1792502 RepID=A0A8J2U8N8_9BACT|nr:HEPN domain-containing protein [Puia dinghuensis]GGA87115.1 nucleotidyltransferase [Puia dinghuensis]